MLMLILFDAECTDTGADTVRADADAVLMLVG
jgi:hypothetical protein